MANGLEAKMPLRAIAPIAARLIYSMLIACMVQTSHATQAAEPSSEPSNQSSSSEAKPDIDFGPYMAALQRQIKRAWFPPKGNQSKRVTVLFTVDKSGVLSDLKLAETSGVTAADDAALRAVRSAAPFMQLPSGSPPRVDIKFTFDYNVLAPTNANFNLSPPFKQNVPGVIANDSTSNTADQGDAFEAASSASSSTSKTSDQETTSSPSDAAPNEVASKTTGSDNNEASGSSEPNKEAQPDNQANVNSATIHATDALPERKSADDSGWLPLAFGGAILLLLSFLAIERLKEKQAINLRGKEPGQDS